MNRRSIGKDTWDRTGFAKSAEIVVMKLFWISLAGFFLWVGTLGPWLKTYTSNDWKEAPCVIVGSELVSSSKSSRAKVEFEYVVLGRKFRSETYDFTPSRGFSRCKEIVAANPVGKQTVCYYDVDYFRNAVIVREFDFSIFGLIIPSILLLIGLKPGLLASFNSK